MEVEKTPRLVRFIDGHRRSPIVAESVQEGERLGIFLTLKLAKFRNVQQIILEGNNKALLDNLSQIRIVRFGIILRRLSSS